MYYNTMRGLIILCNYLAFYSPPSYAKSILRGDVAKNGVHAFDYNSAERELIWMKSGAL